MAPARSARIHGGIVIGIVPLRAADQLRASPAAPPTSSRPGARHVTPSSALTAAIVRQVRVHRDRCRIVRLRSTATALVVEHQLEPRRPSVASEQQLRQQVVVTAPPARHATPSSVSPLRLSVPAPVERHIGGGASCALSRGAGIGIGIRGNLLLPSATSGNSNGHRHRHRHCNCNSVHTENKSSGEVQRLWKQPSASATRVHTESQRRANAFETLQQQQQQQRNFRTSGS